MNEDKKPIMVVRCKNYHNIGGGIPSRESHSPSSQETTKTHSGWCYLKIDRKGKIRNNQEVASCLTIGGHGCGNHSDMDLLVIYEY